jgi:7-cyano-7-deazaguanine reductase
MAQAQSHTLAFKGVETIDSSLLEVFAYAMARVEHRPEAENQAHIVERPDWQQSKRQTVKYETSEFSAVCPFSGLPDLAYLAVEYIPQRYVLELKSFKYYLLTYRQVGIYQEHATHKIYEDLFEVLKPRWLRVVTKYNTRGGIDAACTIDSREQ